MRCENCKLVSQVMFFFLAVPSVKMSTSEMEALRPGGRVILHGLAALELNGTVGKLQAFHEDKGSIGCPNIC